jgi:hypothetical protein
MYVLFPYVQLNQFPFFPYLMTLFRKRVMCTKFDITFLGAIRIRISENRQQFTIEILKCPRLPYNLDLSRLSLSLSQVQSRY